MSTQTTTQTTQATDRDRFFSMAECYDRMAGYLVPRYDWLQNELIALLFADGVEDKRIVDLGAGSGILLDKLLTRHPQARAVWVDFSGDFHTVARRRLARHGRRVEFVLARLEEPWQDRLGEAPHAVCSMSAIHHLEPAAKQELYARIRATLRPGGWFYNVDETATLYDDAYRNTLAYWARHVETTRRHVPPSLEADCRQWCATFERWKQRNMADPPPVKTAGDDIHDGYVQQMRWLRQAGFVEVDLFMKFQLWSAFGGRKPSE